MSKEHLPLSMLLGGLHTVGDEAAVQEHLRQCKDCMRKLVLAEERIANMVALAPGAAPPPTLRERILRTIAETPRHARFTELVAKLLDISTERARAYLVALDDPSQWQKTPFDGVTRIPVQGGPLTTGAVAHFVRVEPGKIVPMHSHFGPETGVFLQGRGRGDDGRLTLPGELDERATGTAHSVEGLPGVASVMLVVAHGGVRFAEFDFDLLPGQ
jgi:anti-sigma factor ChrR (cupin superfamily)